MIIMFASIFLFHFIIIMMSVAFKLWLSFWIKRFEVLFFSGFWFYRFGSLDLWLLLPTPVPFWLFIEHLSRYVYNLLKIIDDEFERLNISACASEVSAFTRYRTYQGHQ